MSGFISADISFDRVHKALAPAAEIMYSSLASGRVASLGYQILQGLGRLFSTYFPQYANFITICKDIGEELKGISKAFHTFSVFFLPIQNCNNVLKQSKKVVTASQNHEIADQEKVVCESEKQFKNLLMLSHSIIRLVKFVFYKLQVYFILLSQNAPFLTGFFKVSLFTTLLSANGLKFSYLTKNVLATTGYEQVVNSVSLFRTVVEVVATVLPVLIYGLACASFIPYAAVISTSMTLYSASWVSNAVSVFRLTLALSEQYLKQDIKLIKKE